MVGNAVIPRVRDLKIGQRFTLKRTGDVYLFIGYDRRSPGGTLFVARRRGFLQPTTLHHSCHVILDGEPMANQWRTISEQLANQAKTSGSLITESES